MFTETIQIWDAIAQMRKLSKTDTPFSIVHATYNKDSRSTDGIRKVKHAVLRPQAKGDVIKNADHKLFYTDLDKEVDRNCWQILLMGFNDKKIEI